jgi:hypothetical protein
MTRAYKSSLIYGKTPIHIPWITSMRGVNEEYCERFMLRIKFSLIRFQNKFPYGSLLLQKPTYWRHAPPHHSRISRLKDHVSMYFDCYPKMVNVMKLEWVVLNLSGLILK